MEHADIHMPWIGRRLEVVASSDPTYVGCTGLVLEETQRTLVVQGETKIVTLPKREIRFRVEDGESVIDGQHVQQRSEDRIHRRYEKESS